MLLLQCFRVPLGPRQGTTLSCVLSLVGFTQYDDVGIGRVPRARHHRAGTGTAGNIWIHGCYIYICISFFVYFVSRYRSAAFAAAVHIEALTHFVVLINAAL